MAYKCREEIVGKRFLTVSSGFTKLKGKIQEWTWRGGVIRAATHRDSGSQDLQVLVEYDDVEWHRREWISIYKDDLFHLFMVEQTLVWAERRDPFRPSQRVIWPALTFSALVNKVDIPTHLQPVEFLLDRELAFKDYKNLKSYQEWDLTLPGIRDYPELRVAAKRWTELQDGQRILLTTPSILMGYRVEVYRAEGTTQWYTAVIIGYNEATRDLTVTDDTVLEEHNEDPSLVQMRLIGDGVVESIMRGEDVGITPRRSRSSALLHQQNTQLLQNRVIRGFCSNIRKQRSGRLAISESGISPEPPDKGSTVTKSRKRKTSETELPSKTNKEDLENKQKSNRKTLNNRSNNRKKVLEEANNSKLREIEVVVEDCCNSALYKGLIFKQQEEVLLTSKKEEEIVEKLSSPGEPRNKEEIENDVIVQKNSETPRSNDITNSSDSRTNEKNESNNSEWSSTTEKDVVLSKNRINNNNNTNNKISSNSTVLVEDNSGAPEAVTSDEEDCVIVTNNIVETSTPIKEHPETSDCSIIRGDDDGPLSASSPYSRMDFSSEASSISLLRFADDRSDSGVSSLRSGSGDERSGSRSSALSLSDEPTNIPISNNSTSNNNQQQPAATRSPLFIPTSGSNNQSNNQYSVANNNAGVSNNATGVANNCNDSIRVWRDPSLLLDEQHVRHIHSVQHQTLLMSHPTAPASSGPPPPTSSAASLYPSGPPSNTLMPPIPLTHPHHLAPHATLYHPAQFTDMLWKQQQRFGLPAHLLAGGHTNPTTEELIVERERERALMQDRDRHERMIRQTQELEKQQKEKERIEREKQIEKEREQREREREEKERQDQALQNHFEKSLRHVAPTQKREAWNQIGASRPPQPRTTSLSEEDRNKREQEIHQRAVVAAEQQRHLASIRVDSRDHRNYYSPVQKNPVSVKSSDQYAPPPAHAGRLTTANNPNKSNEKLATIHPSMVSSKNDMNMYSYPVCNPHFDQTSKGGAGSGGKNVAPSGGLIVTKMDGSRGDRGDGRGEQGPPPLVNEMKNSVIVKHEGKTPQNQLEARVSLSHSPSPKMRGDMMGHYNMPTSAGATAPKANIYEYRNMTPSPHHLSHVPSPSQQQQQSHHHAVVEAAQNLGKSSGMHGRQLPSPHHHQRQSPHHVSQQDMRYMRTVDAGQAIIFPSSGKAAFPYHSATTAAAFTMSTTPPSVSNSKPKVSSPAPHHIYGKPSSGISVTRTQQQQNISQQQQHLSQHQSQSQQQHQQQHDLSNNSLSSVIPPGMQIPPPTKPSLVTPSPYQQVPSQYHPPNHLSSVNSMNPPPAHSSRRTSTIDTRYDRYNNQPGTSPPIGASAPMPIVRNHPGFSAISSSSSSNSQVQTQPLDLGVSSSNKQQLLQSDLNNLNPVSPKRKGSLSGGVAPVCLEVKKRRVEQSPSGGMAVSPPQLARVSEPSPLIASAATTITTVVNTAAIYNNNNNGSRAGTPLLSSQQSPIILTENLPDLSVTAVENTLTRPCSRSSDSKPGTPNTLPPSSSPVLAVTPPTSVTPTPHTPLQQQQSDESPLKTPTTASSVSLTPSIVDSEKSNSPGPPQSGGGGKSSSSSTHPVVRHLKKAWLQRHNTGEDLEDTTGVIGSGICVTLPMNISKSTATVVNTTAPSTVNSVKEGPIHSLHAVGSMAVNSINKTTNKHYHHGSKSSSANTTSSLSSRVSSLSSTASSKSKDVNVNGHSNNEKSSNNGGDDSSSSDAERGRKSPPKRKPPKVKRKKGGGAGSVAAGGKKPSSNVAVVEDKKPRKPEKPFVLSESGSDSDKESGSDKDSDSGASTTVSISGGGGGNKKTTGTTSNSGGNGNGNSGGGSGSQGGGGNKEQPPRKRGRRPKSSKNDKGEEPRAKKIKEEPQRDPFRKPPVGQLKKTGESFLQDGPCFEVAPKLAKCRECRWTPNQRSKNMPNIFCRFYAFRRLRYTKNGQLAIAGFSDPHKDALENDIKLWLPNADSPPSDLELDTSRFLLKQVGDHFCDLLVQEKEANTEHMSDDKTVAWKRVVQGVREMCDVCETTLFNCHWACGKCGFVVCLDCYKSRKVGTMKIWGEPGKDRDDFSWLLCTNRQPHEQEKLMLTQIIAGDCLLKLGKMVHEMRDLWAIEQFCGCPSSKETKNNASSNNNSRRELIKTILNGLKKEITDEESSSSSNNNKSGSLNGVKDEVNLKTSPLSWLADVALSNNSEEKTSTSSGHKLLDNNGGGGSGSSSSEEEGNFSTLRELLIRPSHKPNGSRATSPVANKGETKKQRVLTKAENLEDVISNVIEENVPLKRERDEEKMELKHFVRRYNWQNKGRQQLPIRIMTLTESKNLYPDVPHSWLCDGKLLRLTDPTCKNNYKIFQDQWKRGQPVIVSDVTRNVEKDLWHPDSFARDFGDEKNDLINCMTGNLVPNQPMRKFWEGFDHFSKRLKDDRGQPMLLKLKDWPPGEDFAEMLPTRYADLMKVLPLSEYTHRTGRLNLASRLPDCFVRPDLGPKMYNAYGSALHPNKGTTNLHLDISDAVNVMVYVGIPKDGDSDEHVKEAFRAIDEAGCDILTRRRVRDKGELPGALWHIYNARDADKIRDLLNKVVVEKGGRLEPHHDPIHDQSCYLDGPLRERLYKEYGVEGYAIVQCLGDAVFIPAGAPHQVRNLHNCIKVAEDFVSPENVSHCFHLTQEFRDLSDTHSNHEDKLQIKNIIYHAVKDSLSTLTSIMNEASKKLSNADKCEQSEVMSSKELKVESEASSSGGDTNA